MKQMFLVAALPLAVSGCASTLPDIAVTDSNPAAMTEIVPVAYQNPVGDYTHRVPIDPKPWRSLNDAQAPNGGS